MYIDEPVAEPKPDEKVGGGDGSEANGEVRAVYESPACMRTYIHTYLYTIDIDIFIYRETHL